MTGGTTDDVAGAVARGLASGARLPDCYEVRRMLGRGAMGVVYEAFDRARGARVALKTMRGLDASALHRLRSEFRSLAQLSHPNLVSLYDLESDGDATYVTMEYVEGVDFLAHVTRAPRDAARLRAALLQLVEGISALHGRGKLHRDLKPSNVLVTPEGRVVVLDFGLVSSFGRESLESAEHDIVGTPEYMSPEQASGAELTEASDWYSVGVMLYEAIVGGLPFTGPPMKVLLDKQRTEPPPLRGIEGESQLDALCAELLRRDPGRRPTARHLRERLGGAPSSQPPAAPLTMPTMGAPFVGREEPMRRLAASFASARDGRLVVACVHGGSGMGKTLLVRHWLDTLGGRDDVTVLMGRCQERESVPHPALDDLMGAVCRHLQRLPGDEVEGVLPPQVRALAHIFPALGRVEAVSAVTAPAEETPDLLELRRCAATALRELLHRMASRGPVVLWIDDLQWGDPDSATLIEEMVRPPEAPPMLLIVSYRAEDASARLVVALREALARDGRGSDVPARGDGGAVAANAGAHTGSPRARRSLPAHERSYRPLQRRLARGRRRRRSGARPRRGDGAVGLARAASAAVPRAPRPGADRALSRARPRRDRPHRSAIAAARSGTPPAHPDGARDALQPPRAGRDDRDRGEGGRGRVRRCTRRGSAPRRARHPSRRRPMGCLARSAGRSRGPRAAW